jgi:hypothetical protein
MSYARCSVCGYAMRVEKVSNDVMMMWCGKHCGLGQAYFARDDIFETLDGLEKKNRDNRTPRGMLDNGLGSAPTSKNAIDAERLVNNPQQSWGFEGEPPEAVIKDFGTRDGTS